MSDYLMPLLGTALVNNMVLVKFLGLCPFMGVSKKLDSADPKTVRRRRIGDDDDDDE